MFYLLTQTDVIPSIFPFKTLVIEGLQSSEIYMYTHLN